MRIVTFSVKTTLGLAAAAVAICLSGCQKEISEPEESLEIPQGELVIRARLEATSAAPDPKTAPYPDCLITARFKPLEILSGQFDEGTLLASFWAFQKRVSSGTESLGPGDTVVISLAPAESVKEIANAMRIDHTDDYLSPHYFALDWIREKSGDDDAAKLSPVTAAGNVVPPVATKPIPPINQALLDQGGDCIEGSEGFFFYLLSREIYRPGFWNLPENTKFANGAVGALPAILDFHRQLSARKIPLLIVIVPRSSSVFPDLATGLSFDPETDRPVNFPVENFAGELREHGIRVLNLTPGFLENRWFPVSKDRREPVCLPNDDHWSPAGAKLAARLTAAALGREPFLSKVLTPNPSAYESVEIVSKRVRIRGALDRFFPESGKVTPVGVTAFQVQGTPAVAPKSESRPVVIGDSFLRMFEKDEASFVHHLEAELKQKPRIISSNGGVTTARQILAREVDLSEVSLVIWEFAEDFLALHQNWRLVPLADRESTLSFTGTRMIDSARKISGWKVVEDEMFGFAEKSLHYEFPDGANQVTSLSWENIRLGENPSFSATLSIGPSIRKPGESRTRLAFEIWFDGERIASRSLESRDHRNVWLRDWEVPLDRHGGRSGVFEIRCVTSGESPVSLAALRNPELRHGFAGAE